MNVALHSEQVIGIVERVDGAAIEFSAIRAADRSISSFGERVARGEVGEFVVVENEGQCLLARIEELRLGADRHSESVASTAPVLARAALLATLNAGKERRGISRHPRIGDRVYSANAALLSSTVSDAGAGAPGIAIGVLSRHPDAEAAVSLSTLLGRHLAVVGTTGSGKSWTVATLCERLAGAGGRAILIDATGEFETLGDLAKHVVVSRPSADDAHDVARLNHSSLDHADLCRLLQPAPGMQAPKLNAAISSLRLAFELSGPGGTIEKAGRTLDDVETEMAAFRASGGIEDKPWLLGSLPDQLRHECYRQSPKGKLEPDLFALQHIGSLISRVQDVLNQDGVQDVFAHPLDEQPTLIDVVDRWLASGRQPLLRIDLGGVPFGVELRELVANVVGRHLLGRARRGDFATQALTLVLDEAHQFLRAVSTNDGQRFAFDSFDSISKEGRKYGLHLVVSTQRPGDLPAGVLSQMGALLVHRLADGRDREHVEHAASDVDRSVLKLLPSLTPGEALMVGVDFPVPATVRVHPPSHRPFHAQPPFVPEGATLALAEPESDRAVARVSTEDVATGDGRAALIVPASSRGVESATSASAGEVAADPGR